MTKRRNDGCQKAFSTFLRPPEAGFYILMCLEDVEKNCIDADDFLGNATTGIARVEAR